MNIKIITVGKLKEKYLLDAVNEYTKRIKGYAKVTFVELNDEKIPSKTSDKIDEGIKEKEGINILSKIDDKEYVIALCVEGKQIDSVELAKKVEELPTYGKPDVTFVIGGSLGLSDEVKRRANFKLSFSKMTFPHQLMKVILLEQIYRSFKIIKNETYHK